MIRFSPNRAVQLVRSVAIGCACAFLLTVVWARNVHAYPYYDNGSGSGCVQCHNGFKGSAGSVLHQYHLSKFGISQCNLCHPNGGGTTPVETYWSGPGGGYGCAGCHGRLYGEISPNSGQAKATGYGLRQFHVNHGVPGCPGCHFAGSASTGTPNPLPPIFAEDVAPPYYNQPTNNLTNPCWSTQEDMGFDVDTVGLDNDGNGFADYPNDPACLVAPPTTVPPSTTTTLATPVASCPAAPASSCIAPTKGKLVINEKTAGKEKLKVVLTKLVPAVAPSEFGDPVTGTTSYAICIYDSSDQLAGELVIDRAGALCNDVSCWLPVSGKGYKYSDKATTTDGILKMNLLGGDAGKGKVIVVGKNSASTLPLGITAALQGSTQATVQLLSSDASCFGLVTQVKKADGVVFSAKGP